MSRRPNYTEQEQEQVVLDYFGGSGSEGEPLCPACGESLVFRSSSVPFLGLQLDVGCPGCARGFSWSQPQPERPWKDLQLSYFLERYLEGEPLRCPADDCFVTYAEFNDGVVQFNCPYCNRRGRIQLD